MMATRGAMADNQTPELPGTIRLARIGLAALAAVLSVNLWTGAPLLAIWVGSRVQGGTGLSMGAVGAVLGTLAVVVAVLVFLLVRVEAAYKLLSGQPTQRRTTPWLRSLRDERPELSVKRSLTGFEKAIIATVVVAIAAFELWFFVLAGSPIG
ncbi:MAG: hypothetical protein JWM71_334 [Solirubrobacteraceae bacterium]|nr:hypothetical protein [Solirubrobacteraceae bacterium]